MIINPKLPYFPLFLSYFSILKVLAIIKLSVTNETLSPWLIKVLIKGYKVRIHLLKPSLPFQLPFWSQPAELTRRTHENIKTTLQIWIPRLARGVILGRSLPLTLYKLTCKDKNSSVYLAKEFNEICVNHNRLGYAMANLQLQNLSDLKPQTPFPAHASGMSRWGSWPFHSTSPGPRFTFPPGTLPECQGRKRKPVWQVAYWLWKLWPRSNTSPFCSHFSDAIWRGHVPQGMFKNKYFI